ncbi:thiamine-binding protein [Candidatus Bathyarchaeota archaeon]|nr:MAG: thiamine-binding protein [Candidatus Bathyarchaeota archaeon]
MVIVEFSIIPLGVGTSVSKFIASALKEIEKRKIEYEVTSMCTIFEAESVKEALETIVVAHEAVFKSGVNRIVTMIKIDDRRDKKISVEGKVKSLLSHLKKE